MKSQKLIIYCMAIAMGAFLWSCEDTLDDELTDGIASESFDIDVLFNSKLVLNQLKSSGFGSPIGAHYGRHAAGRKGQRSKGSPFHFAHRTHEVDSTDHCFTETWDEDDNGNYTYTIDFGSGCDSYGYTMKGKLVETGSFTDSSFVTTANYTGFGGEDWEVDGTTHYEGVWTIADLGDTTDIGSAGDTYFYEDGYPFESTYAFSANLTESFSYYDYSDTTEEGSFDEEAELIEVELRYVASGKEEMDNNGYTVVARESSLTYNNDETLTNIVSTPLFMDYTCSWEDASTFVSGIESGAYTNTEGSVDYSIDYGDGTCDNLITYTIDGVSEEIELTDDWVECGEGDSHKGERKGKKRGRKKGGN